MDVLILIIGILLFVGFCVYLIMNKYYWIGFPLFCFVGFYCAVALMGSIQLDFSLVEVVHPIQYQYTYGEDTVKEEVKEVEEVIEIQKEIELPVFELPEEKTILLLDKSGSMESLSTQMYLHNAEYFARNNDIWFFNTEVENATDINAIEFGGDTDIIGAVQKAIDRGYKNILLCSDMEQTVPITDIYGAYGVKIFIIAPKTIEEQSALQVLINTTGVTTIESVTIE